MIRDIITLEKGYNHTIIGCDPANPYISVPFVYTIKDGIVTSLTLTAKRIDIIDK